MSEQRPGRYQRSFPGLVAALVVLVVVVLGLAGLQKLNSAPVPNPAPAVPYKQTLKYVRQQAHLDVLAPSRLPSGWRVTSVRYSNPPDEHWHLGVLTGDEKYVGLEQAHAPVKAMVHRYVDPHARALAPVTIDGRQWTAWSDSSGELGFCRRGQGGTTTLVVGTPGRAVLTRYVASLR